jgi:hypothetical protein
MTKEQLLKRFKNKAFLAAIAGGLYRLLNKYGYAPEIGDYQLLVDLISYGLIGWGIYSTFEPKAKKSKTKATK